MSTHTKDTTVTTIKQAIDGFLLSCKVIRFCYYAPQL